MTLCNYCAALLTMSHYNTARLVRAGHAEYGACDKCGQARPRVKYELVAKNLQGITQMNKKYIASVSFGKDSLYMLLELIRRNQPLDEVVFYDTGMEFQAIYNTRDSILPLLAAKGITYTELTPEYSFIWKMFEKPVNGKNGFHYGYSWCGGVCRWGTTDKLKALDKYAEQYNAIVYIGIAADESKRLEKERKAYKHFPLAEWGVTEQQALQGCYNAGYDWNENGILLYDVLDRVSCWCCANKNLKELRNIYMLLPQYWARLKDLQARTARPMKGEGKSVFDLETRFIKENQKEK